MLDARSTRPARDVVLPEAVDTPVAAKKPARVSAAFFRKPLRVGSVGCSIKSEQLLKYRSILWQSFFVTRSEYCDYSENKNKL